MKIYWHNGRKNVIGERVRHLCKVEIARYEQENRQIVLSDEDLYQE